MKKKLITIISLSLIIMTFLIGCNKSQENEISNINKIKYDNNIESSLLEYNKDGMNVLKANFPTRESMVLALKNIGNNIDTLNLSAIDISKSKLKGKNTILEVVNLNDSNCIEAMDILNDLLIDSDINLIPIIIDAEQKDIKDISKNAIISDKQFLIDKFGLTKIPTLIFIDETGTISFITDVLIDKQSLLDNIDIAFQENKIYNLKD